MHYHNLEELKTLISSAYAPETLLNFLDIEMPELVEILSEYIEDRAEELEQRFFNGEV